MQKQKFLERFLSYIQFDTQANPNSDSYPSNPNENVFADFLMEELKAIGMTAVEKDKYGYVTACL